MPLSCFLNSCLYISRCILFVFPVPKSVSSRLKILWFSWQNYFKP